MLEVNLWQDIEEFGSGDLMITNWYFFDHSVHGKLLFFSYIRIICMYLILPLRVFSLHAFPQSSLDFVRPEGSEEHEAWPINLSQTCSQQFTPLLFLHKLPFSILLHFFTKDEGSSFPWNNGNQLPDNTSS